MSTNLFGVAPNQIPTNADLGGMAYQDPRYVAITGGNVNPTNFGTSNAQIVTGRIENLSSANTVVIGVDSTSPSTGALTVTGGVGISANLHVGGNLYVTGNTFTLSTTDLVVSDSIIELHTFANLSALTTNDGRDIGIKMHYYDVADSHAFLGRANDTGYLEWYAKGTEGAGNVFIGSNYGTIKSGELLLANTTQTTSSTTGALRVAGGVGISLGLNVAGSSNLTNFHSGNIYQSIAGTMVVNNFSSANVFITGGYMQVGNAYITDPTTQDLSSNALVPKYYVDTVGIIWGI